MSEDKQSTETGRVYKRLQAALQLPFIYKTPYEACGVFKTLTERMQVNIQRRGVFEPYLEFYYEGKHRGQAPLDACRVLTETEDDKYWLELAKRAMGACGGKIPDYVNVMSGADEYIISSKAYFSDLSSYIDSKDVGKFHYRAYHSPREPSSREGTDVIPDKSSLTQLDVAKIIEDKRLLDDKSDFVFVACDHLAYHMDCDAKTIEDLEIWLKKTSVNALTTHQFGADKSM
jgi:hypothetical protein